MVKPKKRVKHFKYNYAENIIVCKYQASVGNCFQCGPNWEVNLPVNKKDNTFLIFCSTFLFLPSSPRSWIQSIQGQNKEKIVKLKVEEVD